ncbi:TRAP transporter small permease [Microvirga brassicacearum]|uniref:TRAP transporter small permease protein n=1 Tax=Microvirga brassicacearum TaxID=2580413 RepID=A0A5N3PEJ9_9HYPH|nr:TRAP transporter small permease subunit [Microvirga brassicacearum]KAB0268139.1 TRAP transporter small permease [Microvirga brassicacearum]
MQSFRARFRQFAEIIAAALFAAMFAAFLVQVFARYILNNPISWTQELVLILYIWIVFWCAAFLLRERDHITFDMAFEALPPGARRRLAIVLSGIIAIAFVVGLPGTIDYVMFMKIEKSPVLRIRFDLLYSIFAVFLVAVIVDAVIRIKRLMGPSWNEELSARQDID